MLREGDECLHEAVGLFEQAGDLVGQAVSHTNLAFTKYLMGDLPAALEQYELALELYARVGLVSGIANQHMNLGGLLTQIGQTAAAIEHYKEVGRLRELHPVPAHVAGYSLLFLSTALSEGADMEGAEAALMKVRRYSEA